MPRGQGAHLGKRRIDFFVEGSAEVGMGHLSRVRALVGQLNDLGFPCRVLGRTDARGFRFADRYQMDLSDGTLRQADVVVIDALTAPAETIRFLSQYPTRILISPEFQGAGLATHVLVRGASRPLRQLLASEAHLERDSRYAFTTSQGAVAIVDDFRKIRVGLCITAGAVSHSTPILKCLLAEESIESVSAIGDFVLADSEHHLGRLRHTEFSDDPWTFMEDINVFVGGDGVMIAEAVARALPTFSVTTQSRISKNFSLVDGGAIHPVLLEHLDCQHLRRDVTNRDLLRRLHAKSSITYQPDHALALAESVERIVDASS